MSTSVGPYYRIDASPRLHQNFYHEYNIAAAEGLEAYMHEISVASSFTASQLLNALMQAAVLVYFLKQNMYL